MDGQGIRQVAIAILYRNDRFLLQLRDDEPGVLYAGCWGLFGGHLEAGETPEVAVQRELQEEIGYLPPQLQPFGQYPSPGVVRHVFHGALPVDLSELVLGEGQEMGLVSPADIQQGAAYSRVLDRLQPLGKPHQKILLDFLAT